ncbi:MAG: hypothetical protein K8S15_01485 [Candidatus Aegiribacteria sp.]|nr:hypothetical protein [Candidatus Aegiribacteria sp.]
MNQLISLLSQSLGITISQGIVKKLRERLAKDISWLSNAVHGDKDSGYMISRVQSDAQNIGSFIRSIAIVGNQFLLLLASVILTWILLKGAVLVLLPTIILTFLIGMLAYRLIHKRSMVTMESGAIVFGSVGELVDGRETLASRGWAVSTESYSAARTCAEAKTRNNWRLFSPRNAAAWVFPLQYLSTIRLIPVSSVYFELSFACCYCPASCIV